MKSILLALSLAGGLMAAKPPEDLPPLALYPCMRTATAPVLDAEGNDPAWAGARELGPWYDFNSGTFSELQTTAKLVYDSQALYLFVACAEKNPSQLKAKATKRQDFGVWEDDSIEFYLSPDRSGPTYMRFSFNSIGTQLDFRVDADGR